MESSNLNSIIPILNRYKLDYLQLEDNDIQLGGRQNINQLLPYYIYLPVSIGSLIVTFGLLVDFTLLVYCGTPFLLYSLYGSFKVYHSKKENQNTITIRSGQINISVNKVKTSLDSRSIKEFKIKSRSLGRDTYEGQLVITDIEKNNHVITTLFDMDLLILKDNLEELTNFIQRKMDSKILD